MLIRRRAASQAYLYFLNNKVILFWVGVLASIWMVAILAPFVATHDPNDQTIDFLQAPSWKYWMGTDELGRDLFSRIVYGGRISLSVGVVAVFIAVFIGSTLGLIAGYVGRFVDSAFGFFLDPARSAAGASRVSDIINFGEEIATLRSDPDLFRRAIATASGVQLSEEQ